MSSFGVVKERTYELMEQGEYTFTLNDLEFSADGQYGDSLKWVFLIAPTSDPTNYYARDDGMEKTLHQYTDADIILGSRQHEWVQTLTGRSFADGDDPPEDDELIGKRMVAYLGYYTPKKGKSAGKPREKIFDGSAKRWGGLPAPKAKASNGTQPSAAQVSADPTEAELDTALLIADVERLIKRAEKVQSSGHVEFLALMPDALKTASVDELKSLKVNIAADIEKALDA